MSSLRRVVSWYVVDLKKRKKSFFGVKMEDIIRQSPTYMWWSLHCTFSVKPPPGCFRTSCSRLRWFPQCLWFSDLFEETSVAVCKAGSGNISPTPLKLREEMSVSWRMSLVKQLWQRWKRDWRMCMFWQLSNIIALSLEEYHVSTPEKGISC